MWRLLEGPANVVPGTVGIELLELTAAGAGVISETCVAVGVGDSEATALGVVGAVCVANVLRVVGAVCVANRETNGVGKVGSDGGGEVATSLAGSVR